MSTAIETVAPEVVVQDQSPVVEEPVVMDQVQEETVETSTTSTETSIVKKKNIKRKRHVRRENIQGLSRPAMHRIKRAARVERLDSNAVDATRAIAHDFLKKVLADAVCIAKHQSRKTIRAEDVQEAVETLPLGMVNY